MPSWTCGGVSLSDWPTWHVNGMWHCNPNGTMCWPVALPPDGMKSWSPCVALPGLAGFFYNLEALASECDTAAAC